MKGRTSPPCSGYRPSSSSRTTRWPSAPGSTSTTFRAASPTGLRATASGAPSSTVITCSTPTRPRDSPPSAAAPGTARRCSWPKPSAWVVTRPMMTARRGRGGAGGGGGGGGGGGAVDSIPIAGHVLYVPTGFKVNIFAQGIGVRFLGLGPGGTVYATLSGSGQIARLVDPNGDGVAEAVTTGLSGLAHPSGIAFRGGPPYFAEATRAPRLD